MSDVLVVGVAGGTGSGKTTLVNQLKERLGESVSVLAHDNYYRAHDDLIYDERVKLNYDHPDAYETELMVKHLAALRHGEPIERPVYSFADHNRTNEVVRVESSRVILVEGILILGSPELRELMDIKVFVEAEADVRIVRRMLRDVSERGRSLKSVAKQYLSTVKPMHETFVEPSKRFADLIVPSIGDTTVAINALVSLIEATIKQ